MGTRTQPKPQMWILDCKDYVKEFKDDSVFERRKYRHLMPRPTTVGKAGPPHPLVASSFCNSISKTDAFSWDHHLSKESIITEPLVSSRWNPTPEQLKALQEMYQRGVRTPSAEEIQLIAAKLRHFGRIEGKNVFYWFQNHKARERQKRRRQPEKQTTQDVNATIETKETSLDWKCMDVEQNKKLVTSSKCSLAPKGSAASMQGTAVTESRANGWTHLDEEKKQQRQQTCHTRAAKGGEAFVMMDYLSFMNPSYGYYYNQINAPSTTSSEGEQETSGSRTAEQNQSSSLNQDEHLIKLQNGSSPEDNQVLLQLFPPRDDDQNLSTTAKIGEEGVTTTILNANFNPNHFYEFL